MRQRVEYLAEFDVGSYGPGAAARLAVQLVFGLCVFGVFLLARTAVDQVAPTAGPFALIYPAVLIATLFGRWPAGAVTYAAAFAWTWYQVLPRAASMQLVKSSDGPRTLVNAVTILIVLFLAEMFRRAVRRAASQRAVAAAEMAQREAQLREANASLEARIAQRAQERSITWQVSPDLLGALNAEGYFTTSNPAWQSVLGWTEAEVASMSIFELLHPDDVERTREGFHLTQIGQPAIRFPNRYRCKDGGYRWISWVGVPEDGVVYCSGRDITEEKEAAASLEQTQEALRQSQKLEAIGQLTGGVAHDFNNLLTVIGGSASLLRRPDLSEERRLRYLDSISGTVERAAKLTAQLLAFARRQSLKPEVFDAVRNVTAVSEIVRPLIGSRIQITTVLPDAPCFIVADASQFDTTLINLAVNARDAMAGTGELTIEVSAVDRIPAIRSHAEVTGDYVAICVTDTGIGIAEDRLDQIFEPFFTTKGVGQGTGLGLSQVFGFAKQSAGEVRVESVVGEGTSFILYLPRVDAEASEIARENVRPDAIDGEGMRVLVVEDNADVLEFAAQALGDLGYETVHADNAENALAILTHDAGRFDVVFSDVVMPGMSGIELGQEIRRLYPRLPVILTSGYSHVLAQNGSYGFELLHKPYSVEQLADVLSKAARWNTTV